MRMRVAMALIAAVAVVLASAGIAMAADTPHGDYGPTTDACAGCHRTHTAATSSLLVSANTALCLTCHGAGATGAETNVVEGVYTGTASGAHGAGLNGGGFASAAQDTSLSGSSTDRETTSVHNVQGTEGHNSAASMWGAGSSGAGSPFDLYCTSCHDPHGSPNYRMLRSTVNGIELAVSDTDAGARDYTTPRYYGGGGQWQISSFCSACHTRYMVGAGSGSSPSGDGTFAYRHSVEAASGATVNGRSYPFPSTMNLPLSSTNGEVPVASPDNRSMVCLTCHYAHGSTAAMGTSSGSVAWPGGAEGPGGSARSSLLRLDNRGVCQNCHQR